MGKDEIEEERKEEIKEIVDDINRDVQVADQEAESEFKGYTKRYQEYKQEEEKARKTNRFERLCYKSASILSLEADEDVKDDLNPPIKLLGWDITPGMVLSASILTGFSAFLIWGLGLAINLLTGFIPNSLFLLTLVFPVGVAAGIYYKPIFAAKSKMIESSGEMILSILYMVIYLRSSANLEGAIRFAALNLNGPISKDLKGVLWDLEVGNFNRIEESLENYTKVWQDYNEDYLESLQLIKASINEPNPQRRDELLQESIDRILDGTQEKMKHYAQSLKTPVMILNAMGAMLPVLAMIMLPLISVFMGGAITPIHLILTFNIILPVFLYWFMKKILSSRPPSISSEPTSEESMPEKGKYPLEIGKYTIKIPSKTVGFSIFLLVSIYGIAGYIVFPHFYPHIPKEIANNPNSIPFIFRGETGASPLPMLLRSISITAGLGLGLGVNKIVGNKKRREAEERLEEVESQFPTAMFQLGNKVSGGTPIEIALDEAAEATSDLEISKMFSKTSYNIKKMGYTLEGAFFDDKRGALNDYPSQMIRTVMRAVVESSEKGTSMASMAMTTVSNYLDNIHKTEEQLNDLLEETTTTIQMLAYLLAPIVSGVAVGMSQTIISAMYQLSQTFTNVQKNLEGSASQSSIAGSGMLGNLDAAISPELLQFVVGIYLIQLLHVLGTFYMRIKHGQNETYKELFIGKVLISGMILYSISLILISFIFGGIVSGITT